MALIPLPSLQYPADTNLLYQMAKAINSLGESIAKVAGISTFKTKTIPTNALQIVADNVVVLNNQNVNSGETRTFQFDYPDFASEPIVQATPVVAGGNATGRNITVVMQSISPTKAVGVVRFGESGIMTVNVAVTAIGISPTYKG